jgi:glucosylceramidase
VQLRTCSGSTAQTWTVGTDGSLKVLGNKCLDVVGNGTSDGIAVQIWDCTGGAAQKWTYNSANQTLTNPQANKCLDAKDNTSADGTPLQVWTCTAAANQKWTLPA